MILIQIGTNRANDDFFNIVKSLDKKIIDKLILVEPLEFCNDIIKECYKDFEYQIENVAITPNPSVNKQIFYVSKYDWLSSFKKEHIEKHNTNETINEIEVECISINNLFEKYQISNIDILFIDCEGLDDEIIKSINFEKYSISNLYYEHVHINNENLINFLNSKGFVVDNANFSDNLTSLAKKI